MNTHNLFAVAISLLTSCVFCNACLLRSIQTKKKKKMHIHRCQYQWKKVKQQQIKQYLNYFFVFYVHEHRGRNHFTRVNVYCLKQHRVLNSIIWMENNMKIKEILYSQEWKWIFKMKYVEYIGSRSKCQRTRKKLSEATYFIAIDRS